MKRQDIQSKIDIILNNLEKLSRLRAMPFEEFTSDFRNIDSALHRLQTSIQTGYWKLYYRIALAQTPRHKCRNN